MRRRRRIFWATLPQLDRGRNPSENSDCESEQGEMIDDVDDEMSRKMARSILATRTRRCFERVCE